MVTTGTRTVRQVADNPLVTTVGRIGLVGYGVVNLLLAYLVVKVALGAPESEAEAGKGGAVEHLTENPGGTVVLWIVGISLFALALWQLAEAVRRHTDRTGIWRRLASGGEAVAYVVLGISAVRAAAGSGSGGSNEEQAGWTARVLDAPGGPVLVGVAGIGLAAIAALLAVKGLTRRFLDELDLDRSRLRGFAAGLGQVGYLTLGGTYAVVGGLVVAAAVRHDPEKATGLDHALASLAEHPYGTILLLVVALGFACFGAYCFLDARYRRA
jgi:hypothetical protein